MNKVFTQLTVGIAAFAGMLLPRVDATAQQFVASGLQLQEASQLHEVSELRASEPAMLKSSVYVAKDLNGNEYDVDAILKSGKAIMMDFSAVWCGPCWRLHTGGFLEALYAKFGPNGTNQIEIFGIGADGSSTPDKIRGNGPGTMGNWTMGSDGKPVPYPVFADTRLANVLGLPIKGFPTLYLVGPGNKYIECREEVQTNDTDFKKFAELLNLFMTEGDKPKSIRVSGVTDMYSGETFALTMSCATVAPITSVKWEAPEGITLTKVNDQKYNITANKVGSYEIKVTVANKNGAVTHSVTVTVSNPITQYPFFCGMDVKDKLDKGWRALDHDGDGFSFDSYMGRGLMERLGLSFSNPGTKAGAEQSEDCLISFGKFFPTSFRNGQFSGSEINPKNELLSAPLVIPADAKSPKFSCYITTAFQATKDDELKVMVSKLGDANGVELLAPQKPKEKGWTKISADLSAYKGETILLTLVPVVNGSSAIQVDQLRVTMDGTTDVEAPSFSVQTSLYPNPATESLTVQTRVGSTFELFTIDGTLVSTTKVESETTTVAVAQLPAGSYVARITSPEGDLVLRPVIIR